MEKTTAETITDFLINNGVIIVMFILVSIYRTDNQELYLPGTTLTNILMNMSCRLVIALGIAGCVITAGCDLSAGRMIGLGGMYRRCTSCSVLIIPESSSRICSTMNVFLAAYRCNGNLCSYLVLLLVSSSLT